MVVIEGRLGKENIRKFKGAIKCLFVGTDRRAERQCENNILRTNVEI